MSNLDCFMTFYDINVCINLKKKFFFENTLIYYFSVFPGTLFTFKSCEWNFAKIRVNLKWRTIDYLVGNATKLKHLIRRKLEKTEGVFTRHLRDKLEMHAMPIYFLSTFNTVQTNILACNFWVEFKLTWIF